MTEQNTDPDTGAPRLPVVGDGWWIDRYGAPHVPPPGSVITPRVSSYGVCVRDGRVLASMPRWARQWELPGGGMDAGETPVAAMAREFMEETGYRLTGEPTHLRTIDTNYYSDDLDQFLAATMHFYRVYVADDDAARGASHRRTPRPEDVQAVGWLAPSELLASVHVIHGVIIRELSRSRAMDMAKIIEISGADLDAALATTTRQYLCGNLKRPQAVAHYPTEQLEIGVTRYSAFTSEATHSHTQATEFQYMVSGRTAYLDHQDGSEHVFVKGDFYAIEPGVVYTQKSDPGTEILFIKIPSINDKIAAPEDARTAAWMKAPIGCDGKTGS